MLRRISLIPALVFSLLILSGCDALIHEKKAGGELAYALGQTEDGGYILAGARDIDDTRSVALLIKTDERGTEEWSQTFSINESDMKAYSVRQTQDSGYIIAGITKPDGHTSAFLIKADALGNEEWSRVFGGSESDYAYSVLQTEDGGFILAGYTYSYGAGRFDAWLLKTDARGSEEWSQTYGGSESDIRAHAVQQTEDGGYILAGGLESALLLKTDALGNLEWLQTFDESERKYANYVQQTGDGGYIAILSGYPFYYTDRSDLCLVKTDALGYKEWLQAFDGSKSEHARSLQQTQDGGYIIAGGWGSFWLLKTDARGNEEWFQDFGESERSYAYSVRQTQDGGYILAGNMWPDGGDSASAWLIKTDAQGNKEWSQAFGDEYVAGYSVTPGLIFYVALPLVLLVFNLIYFLAFSKDMTKRDEKKRAWLIKFLILGPLAVSWYAAYRKPKDAESDSENKLYHLAKNFALHWSIYLWLFPVFMLLIATFIVGPGYVFVGLLGVLMGVGFLFFFIWIAIWLIPLFVTLIIMLAAKPKRISYKM